MSLLSSLLKDSCTVGLSGWNSAAAPRCSEEEQVCIPDVSWPEFLRYLPVRCLRSCRLLLCTIVLGHRSRSGAAVDMAACCGLKADGGDLLWPPLPPLRTLRAHRYEHLSKRLMPCNLQKPCVRRMLSVGLYYLNSNLNPNSRHVFVLAAPCLLF